MARRIMNLAQLSLESLTDLERCIGAHQSLLDVFAWAKSPDSPILSPHVVSEVVTQDEFTHDCIVPIKSGLFLVYDTT